MGKRPVVIGGAILAIMLLGFLAFQAFENAAVYYYTITEAASLEINGQKIRIKGEVLQDTVTYDPQKPLLGFSLSDGHSELPVKYERVMPDNFGHAQEAILEGVLTETGLNADKLMLQCPSKYEGV